jgi:Rad3-related DNA helicases
VRKISLSVRQFGLPCPRVGSIETHSGYGAPPVNGQEIHVAIQKQRTRENKLYVAEKALRIEFEEGPYLFVVSGRADGFITSDPVVIEEIKSAFDINDLRDKLDDEPNHPYLWQIRTYGYIHYKETGEIPELNLHLVSSRNFKTIDVPVELDIDEYEKWLPLRLAELVEETKMKEKIFEKRKKLAAEMTFPFPSPRRGQKELVAAVSENFAVGTPLIIQAPTGLGKTAGILYPALQESMARGQKVVYVTPKNSQHLVAEEAVEKIQEQGCKIRSVTMTAKSKMCLKEEPLCNPKYCEFAKDYYRKVHENDLINKLGKLKTITARKLKNMGEEFEVCPFELSVEAIERADVVIGDYNYAFAPRGLLGRLSEPLLEPSEKANLVIDEAHNLPSRAQDYFSPSMATYQLYNLEKDFAAGVHRRFSGKGIELIQDALKIIQSYAGEPRRVNIDIEPFFDLDREIREYTMRYLESDVEIENGDPVLRLSNMWQEFTAALMFSGDEFFQTYQKNTQSESLKITCCDASEQLKLAYKEFKNVVAFSATLKPFNYYQELLGFDLEKSKQLEFASPFEKENRKLLIIPQISTKFSDRSMSAKKIAQVIEKVTAIRPGNYIALFPSFDFMFTVRGQLRIDGMEVMVQQRDMKQTQTQSYLDQLKDPERKTLLMGVQGGVFSEGVDFPGDMLIGAFVVGPALPNFDFEREQIRNYYDKRYGKSNAFNYAYVYPAMAKAIQSAGRVIRTEQDRGVIVLMDSRFLQNSYSETMPEGWFEETPQELVSNQILKDIEGFWNK